MRNNNRKIKGTCINNNQENMLHVSMVNDF